MNVLVNLNFAIDTLIDLEGSDGDVDLLSYMNAILDGINLSLGKINNFRVFFDDVSNVVRIIDEHKTEEIKDKELLTIPNFGLESITYDYSFSSNIDPKLSAKIVIAAQGQNGGIKDFSEDVLTYQQLNIDVRDKFAKGIYPALPLPKDNSEQNAVDSTKAFQKLFDHIHYIYSLDNISKDGNSSNALLNAYQDATRTNIKYYKDKATTLLIPLDINLKIDGITGIMPYNAFLLPENRLPLRYQGNKVAFIIFSIDHEFESNQWNTLLKGQLVYRGNPSNVVDDRPNNPALKNIPPPVLVDSPLETTTYPGTLDLNFSTPNLKGKPKGKKLENDTEVITETNNKFVVDPTPISLPNDVIRARDFIAPRENNIMNTYGAYEDVDFTVSSGATLRIGFGSDTITTPGNSVRSVKENDEITLDQAYADLERRIKTEFKPKVIATCEANGVNYDSLPPTVKTVFIDCAYNYGSLWNDIVISYRDGGVPGLINELKARANRGESQVPSRRYEEIQHLGG